MADGTAWSGRLPVTQENQRGSLPLSVAKNVVVLVDSYKNN